MTSRGPYDSDESAKIDAASLPVEVRDLWEMMLRLDPTWRIEDWLVKRASEELKLVEANLSKERMRLEQRLGRVKTLSERMRKAGAPIDEINWTDPHQRNLFDIFSSESSIEEDIIEEESEEESEEEHPVAMLLDYLPGNECDDPLLAIVAQHILLQMEEVSASVNQPLSLETLGDTLETQGINPDEVIEALEWLLERGEIIEVDEDQFALN